jgi:voltage-gated potassium channel
VVDFIDVATANRHLGLLMEEACVSENSSLAGKNLVDSQLRQNYGVIIVAIKKSSNRMVFNPAPSETIEAGDVIVVIGKEEDLKRMSDII